MTGGGNEAAAVNGSPSAVSSWLELESDPGLFTLLVDDFGVKGVQVEEIYDLSKPLDNSTFGFIFLFKWIDRRLVSSGGLGGAGGGSTSGRRNKSQLVEAATNYVTDSEVVNNMFFAHQIVPNSCATHALLSILLNCPMIDIGSILTRFKRSCIGLSPDCKGLAIGSQPRLALAHNSYARPDPAVTQSLRALNNHQKGGSQMTSGSSGATSSSIASSSSSSSLASVVATTLNTSLTVNSNNITSNAVMTAAVQTTAASQPLIQPSPHQPDIFHFVCFVPINGRLYELDGLKPYPVDHGPCFQPSSSLSSTSTTYALNDCVESSSEALAQMLSTVIGNSMNGFTADLNFASSSLLATASTNWTAKFKQIILNRLSSFNTGHNNHEIRFNLMAVVPDRMITLKEQIDLLNENRHFVQKLLSSDLLDSTSAPTTTTTSEQTSDLLLGTSLNSNNHHEENSESSQSSTTPSISTNEQRQLRSRRSNAMLQQQQQQQQKQQQQQQKSVEIAFKTGANPLVYNFLKQLTQQPPNIPQSSSSTTIKILNRLRCELVKMLNEKLDLVDACKLFKIDMNNSTGSSQTITNATTTTSLLSPALDEMFTLKKMCTHGEVRGVEAKLKIEIDASETRLNEEAEKRKKYRIDALRRKHVYDEFIVTYLKILAESGKLEEIIRHSVLPNASANNYNLTASSLFLQPPASKKQRKK